MGCRDTFGSSKSWLKLKLRLRDSHSTCNRFVGLTLSEIMTNRNCHVMLHDRGN